jgi:hypothetical protein
MFYLVEECGSKSNGILRYTICSTEEQFDKAIEESPFTFADGYEFATKEELLAWLHEFATVPKKA